MKREFEHLDYVSSLSVMPHQTNKNKRQVTNPTTFIHTVCVCMCVLIEHLVPVLSPAQVKNSLQLLQWILEFSVDYCILFFVHQAKLTPYLGDNR